MVAIDIGMPAVSGGVYSYPVTISETETVFVAITAYGPTGLESADSNLGLLAAPLGTPGQPIIASN